MPVADPDAALPAPDEPPERISPAVRLAILVAPILGVMAAPFIVWGRGLRWTELGLMLGLDVLTAPGITVGYRRLFVHRSFETSIAVMFTLALLGSLHNLGCRRPRRPHRPNQRALFACPPSMSRGRPAPTSSQPRARATGGTGGVDP